MKQGPCTRSRTRSRRPPVRVSCPVSTQSTVQGSVLHGPCVIGEGTRIIDAYIGPFTSIGPNTEIVRSEVENSIILEECVIRDIGSRISGSLIGRNVTVAKSKKPPQSYKFMVGDNSDIVIL